MPKTERMTTAEVARFLRVDVRTVHRMVLGGRLQPDLKIPGRTGAYLYRRAAVEALAAERSAA